MKKNGLKDDAMLSTLYEIVGEYEPGKPEFGFLYPAFSERSSSIDCIDIFHEDENHLQMDVMEKILGK